MKPEVRNEIYVRHIGDLASEELKKWPAINRCQPPRLLDRRTTFGVTVFPINKAIDTCWNALRYCLNRKANPLPRPAKNVRVKR